jgi:hypothetical protein
VRLAAALAPLFLLTGACSRPPAGMRRLDAGDSNHWFRVDRRLRRLYYLEGGDGFVTRLGVVDLDTGRRDAYRFPHQKIIGLRPSDADGEVKVATVGTGTENDGEYRLLLVESATGRVLEQEEREELDDGDLARFAAAPAPRTRASDPEVRTYGGRRPGVGTMTGAPSRRTARFFPTPTRPALTARGAKGAVYAAYDALNGGWNIEEFQSRSGVRRLIARFPAAVESMAAVGRGLALLRRTRGGAARRNLAMVDAAAGKVALELPWNDGDSEILAADTAKRLLYIRMNEGGNASCWAVRFDEPALRAASVYLARHRAPDVRKLTDSDELGLVMAAGLVVLLAGVVAAAFAD